MRFANIENAAKTRDKILDAVGKLARSHTVPTLRAICRVSGIRSTSTVQWHAEHLACVGGLVRFKSPKGSVYFPVWFIRQ